MAATDNTDNRAFFSNIGRQSVDLGAPGVDIYSTWPGGGYQYLSGTSMATPHVTGAAALAKAAFPSASAVGLKAHFDVPNTRRTRNIVEIAIVSAGCSQVNKLAHAAVNCKRAEAQTVILS